MPAPVRVPASRGYPARNERSPQREYLDPSNHEPQNVKRETRIQRCPPRRRDGLPPPFRFQLLVACQCRREVFNPSTPAPRPCVASAVRYRGRRKRIRFALGKGAARNMWVGVREQTVKPFWAIRQQYQKMDLTKWRRNMRGQCRIVLQADCLSWRSWKAR